MNQTLHPEISPAPIHLGRAERIAASPQFRNGIFVNSVETVLGELGLAFKIAPEYVRSRAQKRPPRPLPVVAPDAGAWKTHAPEPRVVWLGHSTVILELDGARVLVDPVWGERAAPAGLPGPKRFHAPPLPLDRLPALDAVLLTHDHYDHLCSATVRELGRREIPFYTALGVGPILEKFGVDPGRITELDWWQSTPLGATGVTVVSTPARHFSGRSVFGRNRTLWTGFALLGPHHRIYVGGDSGPSPDFALVGQRLGPFDLALLEIGAQHELWKSIHLGPDEAVNAHIAARGGRLLPVHWGTFDLALHAWDEPIERLSAIAPAAGVRLLTPQLGEVVDVRGDCEPWWRKV